MPKVAARPVRMPGAEKKRHKYNAKRTQVDGIRFDSKREAERYGELKMLEKAGEIHNIALQPELALVVSEPNSPFPYRVGFYRADFMYCTCRERRCVMEPKHRVFEDVKGVDTPLSKWKRKHVEAQYGITVRIVK